MISTLIDVAGIVCATAILGPMLVLPGAAIGSITGLLRFREAERYRTVSALLLGLAILPAALSLIGRFAGLETAIGADLALAAWGSMRGIRPPGLPRGWAIALVAWTAIVIVAVVDFDHAGALYHSALAMDLTKHVATVNTLVASGMPPVDPYFLRAPPAGYYYFVHTLAALPVKLTGGLIHPAAAVGALIVYSGFGLFALSLFVWERCRLSPGSLNRIGILLLLLLLSRNLDVLPALIHLATGHWPINIERWNEQIVGWPFSSLWVPHHVVSLTAGVLGLFILIDDVPPRSRSGRLRPILASLAFASCVGASVWVGLGVALTCALWLASLYFRGRRDAAIGLLVAGAVAAVLLLPQAYDLAIGRNGEGIPIALSVRPFGPWNLAVPAGFLRSLGNLTLLPINYFFEFGVFFIGSILYWRRNGLRLATEGAWILVLCAISGLLLGSFTRSVIMNNDLGWRVVLLAQFPALLWTAAVIAQAADTRGVEVTGLARWPAYLGVLALLGYLGNAYNLLSIRAYPVMGPNQALYDPLLNQPVLDHQLRQAYGWLNQHLPTTTVVQHNPLAARYIFDFGLYSRNRVAVADLDANLYGASKAAVDARVAEIGPIFTSPLAPSDVRARAAAERIGVLIVAESDPVWADRSSWVWTTPALYADAKVRLVAVADIPPG